MILKFLSKKHPRPRGIYAVLKGTYSGEYVVFLKKVHVHLHFISFPDKQILIVPEKDFNEGLEGGVLDFIQTLPHSVYSVVEDEVKRLNIKDGSSTANKNHKPNKRSTSRAKNYNISSRQ
jgi:hypothetical protein